MIEQATGYRGKGLRLNQGYIQIIIFIGKKDREMINRIDEQPTAETDRNYIFLNELSNRRNGTDRRKTHTMLNPDIDKRKGERRNKRPGKSIIPTTKPNLP